MRNSFLPHEFQILFIELALSKLDSETSKRNRQGEKEKGRFRFQFERLAETRLRFHTDYIPMNRYESVVFHIGAKRDMNGIESSRVESD